MSKTITISKAHRLFDEYCNRPSKLMIQLVEKCNAFESMYSARLQADVTIYRFNDDSYIMIIDNDTDLKVTYMD